MFQIQGPILAAMDLDEGSDELLRQADALARSYNVKLSVCHVLPEPTKARGKELPSIRKLLTK